MTNTIQVDTFCRPIRLQVDTSHDPIRLQEVPNKPTYVRLHDISTVGQELLVPVKDLGEIHATYLGHDKNCNSRYDATVIRNGKTYTVRDNALQHLNIIG